MGRTDRAGLVIRAPRARIYAALVDPAALEAWLPPGDMTGRVLTYDARPGGGFRMELTYRDGTRGKSSEDSDVTDVTFVELVPDERVVWGVVFDADDPEFAGTMTMTWALSDVSGGTRVEIRADDVPVGISPADHATGLAASLHNLAEHLADPAPSRRAVLDEVADVVMATVGNDIVRVGIDGVDGAGKTVFADELADVLRRRDQTVIRASVDGFHNPREVRYRQGRHSPVGYFHDSFDYDRLRELLLDPLSPGGSRRYVAAVHDVTTDQYLAIDERTAPPGSVLVCDGIFLHRPELVDYWDCSVFLDVDRAVADERLALRDGTEPAAGNNPRYVEGQRLYLDTCHPAQAATIVIDNDDLDRPRIVRKR